MEPDSTDATPTVSVPETPKIDAEILHELADGRCTPRYLSKQLDHQQPYVSQRLRELRDDDLVEKVDRGLYELDVPAEVVLNGGE